MPGISHLWCMLSMARTQGMCRAVPGLSSGARVPTWPGMPGHHAMPNGRLAKPIGVVPTCCAVPHFPKCAMPGPARLGKRAGHAKPKGVGPTYIDNIRDE
ncbi:hypothetical protein QYF36_023383 [Acer negundo]|nr:hypothetical protein QYF36_023383 [Acer negundo]